MPRPILKTTPSGNYLPAFQAMAIGAVHNLTAGATATVTPALSSHLVRVHSDVAIHIAIGSGATATANSTPVPAGQVEHFVCRPGEVVSVIKRDGEADGAVHITEAALEA